MKYETKYGIFGMILFFVLITYSALRGQMLLVTAYVILAITFFMLVFTDFEKVNGKKEKNGTWDFFI